MNAALSPGRMSTNSAATGPRIGAPASVATGSSIWSRPSPGRTSQFQALQSRL